MKSLFLRQLSRIFLSVGLLTALVTNGFAHASGDVVLSDPLTVRWRYESNITLNLTPAFDTERIYLPLAGGTVVALKAKDGQLVWRSDMGGELSASPAADESNIYVATEIIVSEGVQRASSGALRALGREGGVTQWMTPLVKPVRGTVTISGSRLFAGGGDGRAYAFDKKTGGVLWSIPFPSPFNSQPVVDSGRVYIGSEDGTMWALEESTGKIVWKYRTQGAIRGNAVAARKSVYFGSSDGYVYAVKADKGKLEWRKRTGAGVEAVTLAGENLLAVSLDNFAYLLGQNGSMVWRKLLPGRISAQPLTVQEAALFTPLSSSSAVVLALKDGKQVNSLPIGEELTSSAAPIAVADAIFVTTEHGLLAFARPADSKKKEASAPKNR